MAKEFTTPLAHFDSPLWGFHVMVPNEIAEHFLNQDIKRVKAIFNQSITKQLALMPNGKKEWYLLVNKEVRKELKVEINDDVHVRLEKDDSKYGLPMPPEFEELLHQDELGNKLFHNLTPGKQRNLLHIAGKPKGSDVRLKKSIVIIAHLKKTGGKIDFKQLNEDFKLANNPF